ncbi:putative beta-lactamase (plasmid) [Nostoc sp. NIES-3756]|uniref:class A beta-lactamase n=1 Tax=Nostoc sp. NIES-3756 TaxID=1751286 RepID=UPI00071EA769|nr:class A beta-lactamase [Nostoc sp. NIES-3756]BAT56650.1 putative beta-lactamase [Nostoc sp. NIES-3756]BAY41680.1 putative beta-lactamase [Nostoc sp. NIES-2111]
MIQATIRSVWFYVFCLSLLIIGCSSNNFSNKADNQDSQTNAPKEVVVSKANNENELRDRLEQISQAAQGRVGITATVLETGETVTVNGDQQFPMQSVYKFPIAMAVLAQVDKGKLKLDQKIQIEASDIVQDSRILDENSQGREYSLAELLQYMVSESDSTACDALLRLIGEPQRATKYLRDLGVDDIVIANTENEIQFAQDPSLQYRNYATPDAAVNLLRAFHQGRGLSESSQTLLRQWMTKTSTGSNRIKALLPEGTVVAHKTGTSATIDGVTAATNDVGLVTLPDGRHLAIAVFVSDSTANNAIREEVIAKVTRAVWDEWRQ